MMKKLILLCVCIVLGTTVYAQRVDKPGEAYDIYCVFTIGILNTNNYTSVSICNDRFYLINEKNEELRFVSYADGLTYMTKRGWEYVERINTGVFLLKKKVTTDEQAKKFLIFDIPK